MARRKNDLNAQELETVSRAVTAAVTTFDDALALFMNDCERRGLRPFTIKYYRREIASFFAFLESVEHSAFVHEVVRDDLTEFIEDLQRRGRKPGTINAKIRAIRAIFAWLAEYRYIGKHPFKNYPLVKDNAGHIETFSLKQVKALLAAPNKRTFTGQRDYTLMLLLLETGVRLNEVAQMNVEDVRLDEGAVLVREAKNRFARSVPIQSKMREQMRRYLKLRGTADTEALFVTLDGEPLRRRSIQTQIAKYGREAKIEGVRCSPHTFRHTMAKMSVMNGAGVFELQKILGHSSLDMVRVYVNLYSSEIHERHRDFSPLKDL